MVMPKYRTVTTRRFDFTMEEVVSCLRREYGIDPKNFTIEVTGTMQPATYDKDATLTVVSTINDCGPVECVPRPA